MRVVGLLGKRKRKAEKTLRKTKVDSYVNLWDDSVEALKDLLGERKRELGRDLTAQDSLFVSGVGTPLNINAIELVFRNLATRAGLYKKIEAELRTKTFGTPSAAHIDFQPGTKAAYSAYPLRIRPEAVVARMTPEQIRPAVISWVKSLEAAPANSPDQVVDVDSGELDRFLKLGWRFVSIVNAKKAVVRWESGGDPLHPATSNAILD